MQSCSIHSKYILSIDRVKGPENMIPFLIGLAQDELIQPKF